MRATLTTVAEILGMAAISAGFTLIWVPLGLIAAGISLIALGWALG